MKYNITRLRKILIEELKDYPGEPILLPFDSGLLGRILFEDFLSEKRFKGAISEILTKINYSNVSFRNFRANGFDFSPYTGIKIDPQEIYEKNLTDAICSGVEFIGNFDNVKITGTNFKGSRGAKINPQTIDKKDLTDAICSGVEFIGSFDRVLVEGADFTGSKGVKINPETISSYSLKNTICADVEFIGYGNDESNFSITNIEGADFTGSNYEETIKFENEFREKIKLMTNGNVYVK